ncbi:hypothetical protein [Microbacterium maritypicum]|uniref:Uncharacterized protein n=1 Tax=Microbacterium maritypicum MF109 TaxID=1333857 RepID=T5KJG5_MICMQ|nr:hypothetical protein [Microbacterium liquefaciens]EQM74878.1 hypothetical protein L687_05305 [Microbacterium maritypicum MF109]
MTRLKAGESIVVVEFGLEWRDANGSWHHEVFAYPNERRKKRDTVEALGATDISEHMRDRRVEYSPWMRTDRRITSHD